jgi:transcriptional regulator with XRE-family HTH domain
MVHTPAGDPGGKDSTGDAESTVGDLIRETRMKYGLKQPGVARRMIRVGEKYGISVASVSGLVGMIGKWEHNKVGLSQTNRHLLAEALQVRLADLGLTKDKHFVWPPRRLPPAGE